jgi:hypothetical protein
MTTVGTTTTRQKVFILANRLVKLSGMDRPQAMRTAWSFVKSQDAKIYTLQTVKKNGTLLSTVVYVDWVNFNEVKGTGRPTPSYLQLFTDVAKFLTLQKSTTTSAIVSNIRKLAA